MKSPSKEAIRQIKQSVRDAQFNIIGQDNGIAVLEQRVLRKSLNLLPQRLKPLLSEYWSLWGVRKTFFSFKVPFRDVEVCCTNIEKQVIKSSEPNKRRLVRKYLREKGPLRAFQNLRPQFEDIRYEYITELSLKALRLDTAVIKSDGFFKSGRFYKKAFLEAIARNDLEFFKRVGNALSRPKIDIHSLAANVGTKLQRFLIKHWIYESEGVRPLYTLTIAQLGKVCRAHLNQNLNDLAVEKTRQRLGLKPFRRRGSVGECRTM